MNWFLFCLRNYTKFKGRASRPEYWYFLLMTTLVLIFLVMLDLLLGKFDSEKGMGLLSGVFGLATLVPSLSTGARRLHDTGRSGWWQLVNLVPYVGMIAVFVLLALRGQPVSNQFGDPPTHPADANDT